MAQDELYDKVMERVNAHQVAVDAVSKMSPTGQEAKISHHICALADRLLSRTTAPTRGDLAAVMHEAVAAAQVRVGQDGEVERLREALIATGRNVGALLAADVSTDFLMHVPEEARLMVKRLTRERDEARADADQFEQERDEARAVPWPKWADECRRIIREHSGYDGYDDADGIDLPQELEEQLNEYLAQSRRKAVEARVERETARHRDAAEYYCKQSGDLRDQFAAAQETNERLRSVLRKVEWSATYVDPVINSIGPGCPICSASRGLGFHAPDCALAAALLADPATDAGGEGAANSELLLLDEVCAIYALDETRFLKGEGEPYGSIPTDAGLKAREAGRRYAEREAAELAARQSTAEAIIADSAASDEDKHDAEFEIEVIGYAMERLVPLLPATSRRALASAEGGRDDGR